MRSYPLVLVHWLDAVSAPDWCEHGKIPAKPMPTKTAGYLVRDTKRAVTVAALVNDHHVALAVTIPRRMIRRIDRLEVM